MRMALNAMLFIVAGFLLSIAFTAALKGTQAFEVVNTIGMPGY